MYEEMMGILIFLIIVLAIVYILSPRKSKRYRKEIADMYVASRIRQLAGEDKLDLAKEAETFKGWCKKERINQKDIDLDGTIEEDLIDRVNEPAKKKVVKEPTAKKTSKKK